MSIFRYLLLIIIIVIFSYILFDLIKARRLIFQKIEKSHMDKENDYYKEGMSNKDADYAAVISNLDSIAILATEFPSGVISVQNTLYDLPLKQFCIKGSYNSAYSGKYVSDEMVKYVLSRGCRFLDFELYYLPISNNPTKDGYDICVGYSNDPTAYNPNIHNTHNVPFYNVLKNTIACAFSSQAGSSYVTTNTNDPLFIQLRLKTDKKNRPYLYKLLKDRMDAVYQNGYSQFFYKGVVDTNEPIREFMRKVIFVFEDDENNDIFDDSYMNMIVNTKQLILRDYSTINLSKYPGNRPNTLTSNTTDVDSFTEIVPVNNVTKQGNPSIYASIKNYGNQITMNQYYSKDDNLLNSETMFKQYNGGIVPMAYCLKFIDNYALPSQLE